MKGYSDKGMGGMDHDPKAMNERYMPKGMKGKVMGHEKKPMGIKVESGQGFKEVKNMHYKGMKGYSDKAYDYKY